ncbi:MAG: RNA polymerase-associated protein RapA [Gammaproteobacteria bacterium]|nr:RNA polymerase-associated protein RapA [Gammaproteobacteria bacterium]
MQQFTVGQRWVSAGELQLGVGMVLEVEFRTVSIIFPATGETRIYAKEGAPLTRVEFSPGDRISDHEGREMLVEDVEDKSDLKIYHCVSDEGEQLRLSEGKLNNFLKLNQPVQRLVNGQIDKNKWFELRARTQKILSALGQSSLQGLTGCRTTLIDHQLYIAHEVAGRFAPRVLLADEVGLGKTIEAGLILHQQLLKERAQRVLIVVPESLVHQWLVEMMRRFNLLFSVFDEERCEAIDSSHEGDQLTAFDNPFHTEQLVLCSLEFLTEHPERFTQSLKGDWDMLVVDEAHHLVWAQDNPSLEYQCIEQLASVIKAVLLLTATPEQLGKESHFARLRLLDPNRFSDLNHFINEEQNYRPVADIVEALMQDSALDAAQLAQLQSTVAEGDNQFQIEHLHDADEELAQQAREQLVEHLLDRHGTGRVLFRNTRHAVQGFPQRQLEACALECPPVYRELYDELSQSEEARGAQWLLSPETVLEELSDNSQRWVEIDPRVDWLVNFLQSSRQQKTLIICSSAQTVLTLVSHIRGMTGILLGAFHEGLSLVDRDRAAAWFADQETGTPALICSEIGSEGRNFQFAHQMVMFDLPANPDLLEQRIGRLDRIGQTETIRIYVPYMQQTAQQVMLDWLHQSLNAFEKTCPAGHNVFMQTRHQLFANLNNATVDHTDFIQHSAELHAQLNEQMLQGRDRLLEYNSCRPLQAAGLREQAETQHLQLDLAKYMEVLYDCYGVNYDIHSPGCWVIKPTEHMLAQVPGLPEDGMTITYDRSIALANEDVRFLTWEHPFVLTLMDMVQSSELGNTALLAVKYRGVKAGTLLLDCFFRIEVSDKPGSDGQRYVPDNLLRVCIDENGGQHEKFLTPNAIQQGMQYVDIDTSIKVVKSREEMIKRLLNVAESRVESLLAGKLQQAHVLAEDLLQKEVDRLVALQTINPNVRDEEIHFFEKQLLLAREQIDQANIRLDAIRVLVAV